MHLHNAMCHYHCHHSITNAFFQDKQVMVFYTMEKDSSIKNIDTHNMNESQMHCSK